MGKRSDFERKPRDFYPTPIEAVKILIPHLPERFSYVEPCAGDAALINHFGSLSKGFCVAAYDIEPQNPQVQMADALEHTFQEDVDFFITNPPWNLKLLHPMIEKLSDIAPTWLLFDADWPHTKQSAVFMPRLRKIVSIGRVKWIPDSKMTGKDNCAWYLFDKPSDEPTQFYGR